MGWLSSRMHDEIRTKLREETINTGPVADVQLVVAKARDKIAQAPLVPSGIPGRAEKDSPLVIVDAMNAIAQLPKKQAHFGADQPI